MTRYANMEEAMKGTGEGEWYEEVLTLRDHFASLAMAAIIVGNRADICTIGNPGAALDAYAVADAMLAARKREKSE